MKKKILAMSLALVMVVGNCGVAKAEKTTVTSSDGNTWSGGTTTKNITVTTAASGIVYSVDIEWADMTIKDVASTWLPSSHSYTGGGANWTNAQGGKITVTNHSNGTVKSICTFSYTNSTAGDKYVTNAYPNSTLAVTVASGTNQFDLSSAENVPYNSSGSYDHATGIIKTHALTVGGSLNSTVASTTVEVGTVTITLSK